MNLFDRTTLGERSKRERLPLTLTSKTDKKSLRELAELAVKSYPVTLLPMKKDTPKKVIQTPTKDTTQFLLQVLKG